jgi:hypothetical protein
MRIVRICKVFYDEIKPQMYPGATGCQVRLVVEPDPCFDRVKTRNRAKWGLTGLCLKTDPLSTRYDSFFFLPRTRCLCSRAPPSASASGLRRPPAAVDCACLPPSTAACLLPSTAGCPLPRSLSSLSLFSRCPRPPPVGLRRLRPSPPATTTSLTSDQIVAAVVVIIVVVAGCDRSSPELLSLFLVSPAPASVSVRSPSPVLDRRLPTCRRPLIRSSPP